MIVCSCTRMSDKDVRRAIERIFSKDPYAVVTPGRVYHELGLKLVCHGCRPLISDEIIKQTRRHYDSLEIVLQNIEEISE